MENYRGMVDAMKSSLSGMDAGGIASGMFSIYLEKGMKACMIYDKKNRTYQEVKQAIELAKEVCYSTFRDIIDRKCENGPKMSDTLWDIIKALEVEITKYPEYIAERGQGWARKGLCYHCGGEMGGLFVKKCKKCGIKKSN